MATKKARRVQPESLSVWLIMSLCGTPAFVRQARSVHGLRYLYDKTSYLSSKRKVVITCPVHGDFEQQAGNHLAGKGCRKCSTAARLKRSLEERTATFLRKARDVHGKLYDYQHVFYINDYTDIAIVCNKHDVFHQQPGCHLGGAGCPKCASHGQRAASLHPRAKSFLTKAQDVHGELYDYSDVEYVNNATPVAIKCHRHGTFWQQPGNHVTGAGCSKCCKDAAVHATLESRRSAFLERAQFAHGGSYDYSDMEYVNNATPVAIKCHQHGIFWQQPSNHVTGAGCSKCYRDAAALATLATLESRKSTFLAKAQGAHGDLYDYSNVEYVNNTTPVAIGCRQHGIYWQQPIHHADGGHGCQACGRGNFSRVANTWLERCAKRDQTHIQHAANGGEVTITLQDGSRVKPDGFSDELNKVYEFHGSIWHGEPRIYKPDDINPVNQKSMGELYQRTQQRTAALRSMGYEVEEMWEMDFKDSPHQPHEEVNDKRLSKRQRTMQDYMPIAPPLDVPGSPRQIESQQKM